MTLCRKCEHEEFDHEQVDEDDGYTTVLCFECNCRYSYIAVGR